MPGIGIIGGRFGGGGGGSTPTLTIGVYSDAGHTIPITEAEIESTVYIQATPTGITPTSYLFYSICSNNVMTFIAEQASGDFTWVVDANIAVNRIYVLATDDDDNWVGADINFTVTGITYANSVKFNGIDEYVNVPFNAALEFGTMARTYSQWVKFDTLGAGFRSFFDFSNAGSTVGVTALQYGNLIRVFINTPSVSIDSSPVLANTWYHLVITRDSIGGWFVYLNAALIGTRTTATSTNTGVPIKYGLRSTLYMDGNIAAPVIYNSYLSPSQVTELYNGGSLVDPRGLSTAANIVEFWGFGNGGDNSPTIIGQKGVQNGTMINMDNSNFVADVP